MSDLRDLYQEMILDHGKHPRNFEELEGADCSADGHNPLCGDRLKVFVKTREGRIEKVTFQGSGCAISMASASMMAQQLEGMEIDKAQRVFDAFHEMVTGKSADATEEKLGKLLVFSGVREYPVRIKCATLAWHTLQAALNRERPADRPISTEE